MALGPTGGSRSLDQPSGKVARSCIQELALAQLPLSVR